MSDSETVVFGIDLGTSNTAAACSSPSGAEVLRLSQYTDVNESEQRALLPSCLYHPLAQESFSALYDDSKSDSNPQWVVGDYARRRAVEVPDRVVMSAKSWLCHPGVDRQAAILPWVTASDSVPAQATAEQATTNANLIEADRAEVEPPKLSPVEASALVLKHVNAALGGRLNGRDAPTVVVTVPASFDQVARKLTVEAAQRAGLEVRLLEEPQAAFYDWLHGAPTEEIDALAQATAPSTVLVVDVGGGTTDLTLLRVCSKPGAKPNCDPDLALSERLTVERVAVGRHLLLGGDNIDLALAHAAERKMNLGKRLAASEFARLVAACQAAKERMLSGDPPASIPIRLARRGAALVGNTLSAELSRVEVEAMVLDGFLPEVGLNETGRSVRSGLLSFGLPFERDAAITRHIAQFLMQHVAADAQGSAALQVDAVLFNGGLFKSRLVAERVRSQLTRWMGRPVRELTGAQPEFAVARGAVWYGLSLLGQGLRIGGGSSHGFYIGLESEPGKQRAVSVVPKGAREDEVFTVTDLPLTVSVGKPIRFELFTQGSVKDPVGTLVDIEAAGLQRLPSVSTHLDGETAEVPVRLQGVLSAVGTLDLACLEVGGGQRRFSLEFELRPKVGIGGAPSVPPSGASSSAPSATPSARGGASASTNTVAEATKILTRVFGKGRKDVKAREVKDVWRDLERCLGPRRQWDLSLNRSLFDVLIPLAGGRKRSADHERVFFAVAGYALRPGFGHALDTRRMQAMEPLFEPGLTFSNERLSWEQFYIAWRRVASAVSEQTQQLIRQLCDPFVAPSEHKLKKPKSFKAMELPTLWDLLSWLERVPSEQRAALGQWVLERTWTSRDPKNWEYLGRIGAREPVYGSAHHVVRARHAEAWLEHLLSEPWQETPSAPLAALRLARCTGDRARDVNESLRERVATRLQIAGAEQEWAEAVRSHIAVQRGTDVEVYGEDLPVGLRIAPSAGVNRSTLSKFQQPL